MERYRIVQRTHHIVAAVDDFRGYVADALHVFEYLVFPDEPVVHEVVGFYTADGQCIVLLVRTFRQVVTGSEA